MLDEKRGNKEWKEAVKKDNEITISSNYLWLHYFWPPQSLRFFHDKKGPPKKIRWTRPWRNGLVQHEGKVHFDENSEIFPSLFQYLPTSISSLEMWQQILANSEGIYACVYIYAGGGIRVVKSDFIFEFANSGQLLALFRSISLKMKGCVNPNLICIML